jgi:hypothetical protein
MTILRSTLVLAAFAGLVVGAASLLWSAAVTIVDLRRQLRDAGATAAEAKELRDDLRELEEENSILRASLENAQKAGRIRARGGMAARIPLS